MKIPAEFSASVDQLLAKLDEEITAARFLVEMNRKALSTSERELQRLNEMHKRLRQFSECADKSTTVDESTIPF